MIHAQSLCEMKKTVKELVLKDRAQSNAKLSRNFDGSDNEMENQNEIRFR